MAYATAYTAQFNSLAGVAWRVDIDIDGFNSRPMDISLDRDEPVTIEWPETMVCDAVQASLCTVKVVNDLDRQMTALMGKTARCSVFRGGNLYWRGLIDDSVYEEPYSYRDSYVTEITFSDLGVLNRREFTPGGVMTLRDIIGGMAAQAELSLSSTALIPLRTPGGDLVSLSGLSVNSRRFEGMKQMEVLNGILRSLNLRVMQLNGGLVVYAVESLFSNALLPVTPVVWKGTDARMRGGETFGRYELSFEHEAEPVVADGTMDPEESVYLQGDKTLYAPHYSVNDSEISFAGVGFYLLGYGKNYGHSYTAKPVLAPGSPAFYFVTESFFSDADWAFVALRTSWWFDKEDPGGGFGFERIPYTELVHRWQDASALMSIRSNYLPSGAGNDDYQLRINLDLLLSPKCNPLEDTKEYANYPCFLNSDYYDWKRWKEHIKTVYVPVKLELLDDSGTVIWHYRNAINSAVTQNLIPRQYNDRGWVQGPADESFCEMLLSYYKDGCKETPFDNAWVTNRMSILFDETEPSELFKKRDDGEYIPAPPEAGFLRLTVSDTVTSFDSITIEDLYHYDNGLQWLAYRNTKLTVVRKNRVDDGVNTEAVKEMDVPGVLLDSFSESFPVGSFQKGVSPASLGLLLDSDGNAIGKLVRDGVADTLMRHRLHALEDQFLGDHTSLSGTAELNPIPLLPRSDASTQGVFLATAVRQDLIEDTEEITMALVQPPAPRYTAVWDGPVCATEEERYSRQWSNPVCVPAVEHYGHRWSGPVCARVRVTPGPVWHEMTEV